MSDRLHPPEAQVSTPIVSRYTDGGHEIDTPPNRKLFLQLVVLSAVIFFSGIGIMQLVQQQGQTLNDISQARISPLLEEHRAAVESRLTTYDQVPAQEGVTRGGYRIPVSRARELVLQNPDRLKAGSAPAGFVPPGGAQPAAPAAPNQPAAPNGGQ